MRNYIIIGAGPAIVALLAIWHVASLLSSLGY